MRSQSALRVPEYRNYFIAATFGTFSMWMMRFLFALLTWQLTQSPFWVGVASAGLLLPALFVTPIFGVVSDRINLKSGIVTFQWILAFIVAGTALVATYWPLTLPLLMALIFLFGTTASAGSPLRLTILPKLVGKERLSSAVGYSAILFNSSRVIAPAIAAVLINFISLENLLWGCAALFWVAGVINLRLPSYPITPLKKQGKWRDEFLIGWHIGWRTPLIRLIFVLTIVNAQVGRTLMELLPAVAGFFSTGSASDLATLTASAGMGSIIGGIFMSRQRSDIMHLSRVLIATMLLSSGLLTLLMVTSQLWIAAVNIGFISLLMTLQGTGSQIILQVSTEEATRGRVMSLWLTLAIAGPAVGAFMMGALTEATNFYVTFLIMIFLSLGSGLHFIRQKIF